MTDRPEERTATRGGDRRGPDRRSADRRRADRRAPAPPWRRPWAYVGYGVAGALAGTLALSLLEGGEEESVPAEVQTTTAPPALDTLGRPAAAAPPREAYTVGDFERLLAEGEAAVGQRVRARLFCEPIAPVALRAEQGLGVSASVLELVDATGRVPAARCQWGSGAAAPQLLLIVPPAMAERFAAAPVVEQGFVQRRRVHAEVEWVGRSEALALRNVVVLREILSG